MPRTDLPYDAALHAIQTGVAYEMVKRPSMVSPKQLRVGIEAALVNDAALVRLLIKKGLFTEEEYAEEVRLEACRSVDQAEERFQEEYGAKITLR